MIRLLAPSNFLLLKQIIVIIRKKERMLNFYRKKIGDIEPSLPHEKARLEHHFDLVKIVYSNEYTCYDFFLYGNDDTSSHFHNGILFWSTCSPFFFLSFLKDIIIIELLL